MSDITEFTAREIVDHVGERQLSIRDVTQAFLHRSSEINPALNAIVTINPHALDQAKSSDERLRSGGAVRRLEGVPFVAKDNLETAGVRTTYGSLLREHNVPTDNAIIVERMLAAGAILVGKTNTPEFATDVNTTNKLFGMTRNPLDLNVTTGGSSGGTAAAIAADFSPVGLGTDHGGSIRIPAAWCGLVGIRPSPGRVPVYPTTFAWDTLVAHVCGPLARTVSDLGLVLSVIAGQDDRDPTTLPDPLHDYSSVAARGIDMAGKRIAYCPDLGGIVPVDPAVSASIKDAVNAFEELGATVDEACFDTSDLFEAIGGTRGYAMVARFADLVAQRGPDMADNLNSQVATGLKLAVKDVAAAERARSSYWRKLNIFMQQYDFILTPMIGAPPFRIDQPLPTTIGGKPVQRFYDTLMAAYAISLVGLPAAAVPAAATPQGLPTSLQIIGKRMREDLVLGAAAAYSKARPASFRRWPIRLSEAVELKASVQTPGLRLT